LINDEEDDQDIVVIRGNLKNNKGFFSETTNNFQIGTLNEKEWAGSELLIYKNDTPLPFSI
jgi:hypothetical protein